MLLSQNYELESRNVQLQCQNFELEGTNFEFKLLKLKIFNLIPDFGIFCKTYVNVMHFFYKKSAKIVLNVSQMSKIRNPNLHIHNFYLIIIFLSYLN